jgi:bacterioferritin-associated ferredoxin
VIKFPDEMLEAAARALCEYKTRPCPGGACGSCREKARAVLTAALTVPIEPAMTTKPEMQTTEKF